MECSQAFVDIRIDLLYIKAGNSAAILSAGIGLHLATLSFHLIAGPIGHLKEVVSDSTAGYYFAAFMGSDERVRRTVAIEVAARCKISLSESKSQHAMCNNDIASI